MKKKGFEKLHLPKKEFDIIDLDFGDHEHEYMEPSVEDLLEIEEYEQVVLDPITDDEYGNMLDSVQLFLNQCAAYKLLSREEEKELFRRYIEEGDETAKDTIITSNLRLAVKNAFAYYHEGLGVDILDMISNANMGLLKAVIKFDPSKGCKLSTYATWWIRQEIITGNKDAIVGNAISLPTQAAEALTKIKRFEKKFSDEYGRRPTSEEVHKGTKLSIKQILTLRDWIGGVASLDYVVDGDQETLENMIIGTEEDPVVNTVAWGELMLNLKQLYKHLDLKEYDILIKYYGINGEEKHTLQEISNEYHITKERVRQIIKKACEKLRDQGTLGELADYLT